MYVLGRITYAFVLLWRTPVYDNAQSQKNIIQLQHRKLTFHTAGLQLSFITLSEQDSTNMLETHNNKVTHPKLTLTETISASILRHGQIPQHVVFIMDGGRRWAEENGVGVMEGYRIGVMNVCKVGIVNIIPE